MEQQGVKYEYVSLENEYMKLAYKLARQVYLVKKWNLKTTPVAVLVDKDGKFISHGICADGAHAIEGHCARLETRGTAYDTCPHCAEEQHAERKALLEAYDKNVCDATIYVYGHYKLCESCIKALTLRGVKRFVLLENADVLFDRHNPGTVLGTDKQFSVV